MNLKKLSDKELISNTEKLVQRERETLVQILRNFREIEVRRLFAAPQYKYSSLFDFIVEHFKYPESQAGRRISAMRLLREVPEIEEKIEDGQYRHEFAGDKELQALLQQAKGLLAHSHGDLTMNELLKILAKNTIEKLSPAERKMRNSPSAQKGTQHQVPAAVRKIVWRKAKSKCQHCGSCYKLEVDHILPVAHGGTDDIENLQLLCSNCNQRKAVEQLGIERMRVHFGSCA